MLERRKLLAQGSKSVFPNPECEKNGGHVKLSTYNAGWKEIKKRVGITRDLNIKLF